MESVTPHNVYLVVGALASLVVLGGIVVGIVMRVLTVYRWLQRQFEEITGSLMALQHGMEQRFTAHEADERRWQSDLNAKVDDMRERLARMEGQLSASAEERVRRSDRERG